MNPAQFSEFFEDVRGLLFAGLVGVGGIMAGRAVGGSQGVAITVGSVGLAGFLLFREVTEPGGGDEVQVQNVAVRYQ